MDVRSTRRTFLAAGAAAGAAALLGPAAAAEPAPPPAAPAPLPVRPLGRTGVSTTVFGLGCFPLGGLPDEEPALAVILKALDEGCNYLDTAPSYGGGRSEEWVGKALRMRPGQQVFLATKTHTRTAADARRDLEGSLRRLGRERIDLVQVHAVTDDADLDRVLAAGGPVEALVRAREEGLLRFVGVTGHADPAVMARTFERFAFDAILFPLNAVDLHHELAFERTTLPSAVAKGLGRVAMKAFASGNLLERGIDAEPCLRYVYGLDVATVIVGCRTAAEVSLATRVAREAKPLSAEERAALLERTKPHRGRGVEWYKRA